MTAITIEGDVYRPGETGYEDARRIWNAMIDRSPAVIVRPASVADVQTAVRHAAAEGLSVSVLGGGHNVAGAALAGDLVIDLRGLRGVAVDPDARRATAQGGATWHDLDVATQEHGLAAPGGVVSHTGIGGLTLGGGFGWLRRAYGLACDNLVGVDLVLADGSLAHVTEESDADLFRVLRGSGWGLGVVTSFEFALAPVGPEVAFSMSIYPFERAADVLRAYAAWAEGAPDELTTTGLLATVPADSPFPEALWNRRFAAVLGVSAGPVEEGLGALEPLGSLGGVTAALTDAGARPYVEVQSMFDGIAPAGARRYWSSTYLDALSDEVIDVLLDRAAAAPSPSTGMDIWHLGGAIDRVGGDLSSHPNRGRAFMVSPEADWPADAADRDPENIAWARGTIDSLVAVGASGHYLNMSTSERERESAGLAASERDAVRARVDPHGLFVTH